MTEPDVTGKRHDAMQKAARDHLWMHFARHSASQGGDEIPVIVRGEGPYVYDSAGGGTSTGCPGCSPSRPPRA